MIHTTEDILITSQLFKHFIDWLYLDWETWRKSAIKYFLLNYCFYTSLHDCSVSIFNKNTLMLPNLYILILRF